MRAPRGSAPTCTVVRAGKGGGLNEKGQIGEGAEARILVESLGQDRPLERHHGHARFKPRQPECELGEQDDSHQRHHRGIAMVGEE